MVQIVCDKVSVGYDRNVVLSNLSFSISSGDFLCVIGENGAGKSTFMKSLLGLIPVIKGKIAFLNNLTKKDIGYLPQQTVVQKDFPATCYEIILSGFQNVCGFRPFYNKEEKEKALSVMNEIGILNLKNCCFRELSGGQQQRVLLCRALCSAQKLLILDEPVAGLDPIATNEMYEIIKNLNKKGVTIIMVSHDVNTAIKFATHILYVKENAFFGTKEEFVLQNSKNKFANTFIGGEDNE